MIRTILVPSLTALAPVFVLQASAEEAVPYDYGGRMGVYHQSYILEKTPLEKKGAYRVRTKTIDTTGGLDFGEAEVDCDPGRPSVSGKDGEPYEGKVFDEGFEVSGATQGVYNLLWAVCRDKRFKSLGPSQIYEGYAEIPITEDEVKGRTFRLHLISQDAVGDFWAVRKVTLEYRSGEARARKTAHVYCDYDLPTVTIDGKTHELSDTLFRQGADGERKRSTPGDIWVATCIGRSRFDPKPVDTPN